MKDNGSPLYTTYIKYQNLLDLAKLAALLLNVTTYVHDHCRVLLPCDNSTGLKL